MAPYAVPIRIAAVFGDNLAPIFTTVARSKVNDPRSTFSGRTLASALVPGSAVSHRLSIEFR
jgi:hypothetical protein